MWILWFVDSVQEISKIAEIVGSSTFDNHNTLMVLIIGCVLLGMLLLGTVLLFVTSQRQSHLMIQQKSFVSSVTHELRSPLASLQLSFETMKSRDLDDRTLRKMQDMVLEDIERLTKLVDHILVSSRLDKGITGFSEESQHLHLNHLIRQVSHQAQWLDANIKKRLQIICSENLAVLAPKPVVTLIVSNLLENAIKYSPKESTIKIIVSEKATGVMIAVRDQGFGLCGRERKRIFRMFHRSPITQKKAIPGTGLGLFIVKSLAKTLGGDAWVESPGKDKGSTFFISFPYSSAQLEGKG